MPKQSVDAKDFSLHWIDAYPNVCGEVDEQKEGGKHNHQEHLDDKKYIGGFWFQRPEGREEKDNVGEYCQRYDSADAPCQLVVHWVFHSRSSVPSVVGSWTPPIQRR